MPAKVFRAYNGAAGALSGSAMFGTQATANTLGTPRTMLQIAPASTAPSLRVVGWGYALPTAPAANIQFELLDTGTVFASSLTAHVSAGIHRMNGPVAEPSTVQLGTALTAYYSTGTPTEGTLSTTRLLDTRYENGLSFYWRFELGREPEIPAGNCLRLRAAPSSSSQVSLVCWIDWEE
ncbi:hypothetical protein AB0L97_33060 [Nocardia sp. NPDC051911]|uniref:hypothetical protein n=1 Tax=Nocardia sp. NPDC051911 TaxID=3154648 RepID=UPI00342C29A6